jgi:threonine aldolase
MNNYTIICLNTKRALGEVVSTCEYKALQKWCDDNGYRINLKAVIAAKGGK